MTVFGAFRKSYDGDQEDQRIVFHGIRYLIDSYICKKWTEEDLARSEAFFSMHHAGYTAFPWPKELFHKVLITHR